MSIWDNAPKNSQELWSYLIKQAEKMRTVTYGECAKAIGEKENRIIAPVSLGFPLGFIRDNICRKHNLPLLNALVVNVDSQHPGDSFIPDGVSLDSYYGNYMWRGMVLHVFSYPWENVNIEDFE